MKKSNDTDYKRSFNEANYARLAITIPKGDKPTLQAAADRANESINEYVNKAVLTRMGLVEWPNKSKQ